MKTGKVERRTQVLKRLWVKLLSYEKGRNPVVAGSNPAGPATYSEQVHFSIKHFFSKLMCYSSKIILTIHANRYSVPFHLQLHVSGVVAHRGGRGTENPRQGALHGALCYFFWSEPSSMVFPKDTDHYL